ncbi:MAG: glycosyltransferase family 4 protein [Nonlabens sp.]|nr:glycosyltransferase family 4 protein [Nonlabens sp.]
MGQQKKVLFWVYGFPRISETFIRNQMALLIDQGCDLRIYGHKYLTEQEETLSGFEHYNFPSRFVSFEKLKNRGNNKYNLVLKTIAHLLFSKRFSMYCYLKEVYRSHQLFIKELLIARYCIQNNIGVIHAHFGPYGMEACITKQIGLEIKVITTFHGYDLRIGIENPSYYDSLKIWVDKIIAISNFNKVELLKMGFRDSQIVSIANSVDTEFYSPLKEEVNSVTVNLITVARLVSEKSIETALNALKSCIESRPQVHFKYTLVGEGSEREMLESLVKELGLRENVVFLGAQNSLKVRDALREASIFVLTSIHEAFPTVLLEAQATGLAVISTNVGAVNEISIHSDLIEVGAVDALSTAILRLVDDPQLLKKQGTENRAHIVKHFDHQVILQHLLKLYSDC